MEPIISEVFKNLFPTKPDVRQAIKENMEKKGFSKAHPIILGRGPWSDGLTIIDGHTRYEVAQELDIELQPESEFKSIYFKTEEEAIRHAIFLQKCRRNMTDPEIASCIKVLDTRKTPGRPAKKLASCDANLDPSGSTPPQVASSPSNGDESPGVLNPRDDAETLMTTTKQNTGKSAQETADLMGISASKVERTRVILSPDTPDEIKEAVLSGKKSINRAAKEVKELKKAKTEVSKRTNKECSDGASLAHVDAPILATPKSDTDNVIHLPNSMKGWDERLNKILNRLKSLSNDEQGEILTSWENILDNMEERTLPVASGAEC